MSYAKIKSVFNKYPTAEQTMEGCSPPLAKRFNSGKPKLSHIPLWTLMGEAAVWEKGAKKYGTHNWRKGQPWLQCYDSLMRHLSEWASGTDIDEESGLSHLDHAACNLRMLLTYRETHPELDDRFKESTE